MVKTHSWKKVTPDNASDVIKAEDLEPESAEFLKSDVRLETLIHHLEEAQLWPDAVKVMIHALPVREALWWACICARQMESLPADREEMAALEAAEKWVYKPNDENRRAAFELAQGNSSQSAGTLVALGVGFSAGNIPVLNDQYLDADISAFQDLVAAAVMLAATEKKGEALHERFALFMACGEDIGCGGHGRIGEHRGPKSEQLLAE